MRELNDKRMDIHVLRALPLLVTLFWVIYFSLCIHFNWVIPVDMPIVTLGFYVIYRFSRRFSCVVNRLMIEYAYMCTCCLWYDRYHGFGKYLQLSLHVALIIGLMLLVACVVSRCKEPNSDSHDERTEGVNG